VSTAATLTPGVALHGHARRAGLPLEALRGCWMPADSNPTNEMLALYRFCRFSTAPSAPTASPDAPASPFTRSGPSYQSVHRFGTAPRPAGPSLRPVSPPLFAQARDQDWSIEPKQAYFRWIRVVSSGPRGTIPTTTTTTSPHSQSTHLRSA